MQWKHLEARPHLWRRQLWVIGTRRTAARVVQEMRGLGLDPFAAAAHYGISEAAVLEAERYVSEAAELIAAEAAEDARLAAAMETGGLHRECALYGGAPLADALIVGLGNPAPRYERTPHNVGFLAVQELARRLGASFGIDQDACTLVAEAHLGVRRVVLALPQTYMNDSGRAAHALIHRYRLAPAQLVAAWDDIDLPLGRIRLRGDGKPGTHNGARNLTAFLGTGFARLRMGVGRPTEAGADLYEWVLTPFAEESGPAVERMTASAADVFDAFARGGLEAAARTAGRL